MSERFEALAPLLPAAEPRRSAENARGAPLGAPELALPRTAGDGQGGGSASSSKLEDQDLRSLLRSFDPRAAALCAVAGVAYTLSHFEGSSGFFNDHFASRVRLGAFADYGGDLYWLVASNLLFGLAPLVALRWLREPAADYGLGLGDKRFGFTFTGLFLAVMLPLTFLAAHASAFRGAYPLNGNAAHDLRHFAVWEVLYVGYFLGWEFFHRSFLLFGLRRRIGNLAVFVVALPFMLEHYGKPEPEAWGSFFAAVALGFLAIRARSFWYGFFIHGGVAFFMDVVQSWDKLRHFRVS